MISYAGIGSRDITSEESRKCQDLAAFLSSAGYTLYSGNADGADKAFQEGSNGKFVAFLPWDGFNRKQTDSHGGEYLTTGSYPECDKYVDMFHPNPRALSQGARKLMARNSSQVLGYGDKPRPVFVICCANPADNKGNVQGGTGQAVRIAMSVGIPVFNLRNRSDVDKLKTLLTDINIRMISESQK